MNADPVEENRRLWDARTGRPLATLAERDEPARRAVLSRDGRVAVTVAPDGVARFWDVPSGRLRGRTAPVAPAVGPMFAKPGRPEWLLLSEDAGRGKRKGEQNEYRRSAHHSPSDDPMHTGT